MTSPWTVSASTDRVELDPAGKAEATFTVTNQGPTDQRLVFDVVPGENTERAWFAVAEPQVLVPHGQSAPFLVRLGVPAGAAAGARWFAGRAYSADRAPEETSVVSDRVAVEIKPTVAPVPWWRKWWWVFVVGALVLVVVAVVLFLLLGGDEPTPTAESTPPTTTPAAPTVVREAKAIVLVPGGLIDVDEIVLGGLGRATDLRYDPLPPGDGLVRPLNAAQLTKIGPTDRPGEACARATLSTDQIRVATWTVGEVVCVRTNAGRLAVIVLNQKIAPLIFPPPSPQLRVSITTFELSGGG